MRRKLLMISGDRALAQGKRGALYNTLQELHHHWDTIHVITPSIGKHISQVLFGNVYVHASPWPLALQSWFIYKKGLQLFRSEHFDIMTVHEYPPFYNGMGAWMLARKINIPYVLEVMHFPGTPRAGNVKEWVYRLLMQFFFRFEATRATKVRVINQHQTPEELIRSGVPREKLIYIPAFYIDTNTFKPLDIPKKYDLLFAGRLASNKGVFLFLDAVRRLPQVSACIVGDGPQRSAIGRYVARYGLRDRIQVRGWAPDAAAVAEIMNQSKILIMPSYNEGGPRVVLEAMACGVPVLATPVGVVPDVVVDGDSGRIISWDAQRIAQVATQVLGDMDAYEHMRQKGLEVVQQFERSKSVAAYARGIQQLIP